MLNLTPHNECTYFPLCVCESCLGIALF